MYVRLSKGVRRIPIPLYATRSSDRKTMPYAITDLSQTIGIGSYVSRLRKGIGSQLYDRVEGVGQIDLDRAVRCNPHMGRLIGWEKHRDQIDRLLGFTTSTPDERAFSEAVANWQDQQGLVSNGIIGPATWAWMRPRIGLRISRKIRRSVKKNRTLAKRLGWDTYRDRIENELLGFAVSPSELTFAEAVANWQKIWKKRWKLDVDGTIRRNTWRVISCFLGLGGNPRINTKLPKTTPGLYSYHPEEHQYGLSETVRALRAIGVAWQRANPKAPRIGIGDISCKDGGSMKPRHRSHQKGIDVDIRPIRNDGREMELGNYCRRNVGKRGCPGLNPAYSRPLTRQLVELILDNGVLPVEKIFFNDREIIRDRTLRRCGRKVVRYEPGHNDHLHVRFFCPPSRS